MYVCLTVALCDCVHGKGQHQLGQEERSVKEVPFSWPREQTWLATHHWLSCSQLCSWALRLVEEVSQDQSRPFRNWSFQESTGDPHFTSRGNNQILSQKDPLQAVGLLLWLGARRHWYRCRKYYICPAPPHQPLNYPPKLGCHTLALQGKLRPHLYGDHMNIKEYLWPPDIFQKQAVYIYVRTRISVSIYKDRRSPTESFIPLGSNAILAPLIIPSPK